MASLDGISFDVTTRQVTRTILSSVGGFSQSARQNIRSLQDLLATIQRFGLEVFDSRTLRRDGFIGEGVSYKVTKCTHTRTHKLYAVKTVKLPHKSADSGAFERQVACVLRDIEVMYGLAKRPNILDIYGYGWDVDSGNVIPYLVTEYAAEGTLRSFLKNNELSIHEKLLFCKDVAQGLHFLHVAGIAHGDLKLDNVLVTPYLGMSMFMEQEMLRTTGMEACISDFGHSLHLYDDEGDAVVKQRYGGTLAYNAPEILDKHKSTRENVAFRKCDIWSLGLAVWEILIDGKAYYHNSDVEDSILSSQKRTSSLPTPPPSNAPSQASSAAMIEELALVAPQLAQIACKQVSEKTSASLTSRETGRLHFLFQKCLNHDPKNRLADIPLLPFFHGQKTEAATVAPPSRILVGTGTSWSFELFRVAETIPDEVKKQIAVDCQKIANEPGDSILTARACFQLGFAHATGFGVAHDAIEALHWFEKAGEKGLRLAKLYLPVLQSLKMNPFLRTHDACLEHYLSGNRRAFMARFGSTLLEVEDSTVGFRDADLEQLSVERFTERLSSGIHDIDILYEHGNTSLTLVSKFGITDTTHLLLDKGASAALPDADGSTPLHWLFMYPPEDLQNIAFRLTNERDGFVFPGDIDDKIHVPSAINHVVPFASPINLDPQLPIQLSGTPLAFAVFVHCKKSVKALLQLGADPLLGLPVAGQEGQAGSALAVAFCLHMADILELLLEHLVTCGFPATALLRLLDGLQRTLPAANLQRALIHGCHMQSAAEATITVLLDYYRYAGREPQKWDILKPAAKNLHPLLCRAIVKAMDGGRAQGTLTEENLAELMFICMSGACRSGRDLTAAIEMLELAMRIGSSINYQYQGHAVDRTPLFMAIDRHDGDLLDWMLENTDVDVAVADKDGLTALHRIIKSGFSSTYDIRKLINKDQGLPNRRCLAGNAPIDLVTSDLQLEVFKALLPYSPTESRYKLLEAAIIADAPKLVTANLEALHMKTIPNLINMNTALSVAAQMASGEVAEILISFGANPKSATASGYSTIHEACLYGNIDVLDLCIKLEHDVNLESSQGTPLLIATTTLIENDERSTGARACADALLDAGANPSYMDSDKRTPLAFLLEAPMYVRTKHTALIKKLLEKGADPNEGRQSPLLEYSLTKAIREEDFELAEALVAHNIDLDRAGRDGGYPLHGCARAGEPTNVSEVEKSPSAQLALQIMIRGADPLKKDKDDFTALERAVWSHNAPVTVRLVECFMCLAGMTHGQVQPRMPIDQSSIKKGRRLFRNLLKDKEKKDTPYSGTPARSNANKGPMAVLTLTSTLILEGMTSEDSALTIKRAFRDEPGVQRVGISFLANRAVVDHDALMPPERLAEVVRNAGFDAKVLETVAPLAPTTDENRRKALMMELQEGWGLAVFYKSYMSMTAFIRAGGHGPFTYLTRRVALSLLGHALVNELADVLIKFMGGYRPDGVLEQPDEYLKSIWDSIRGYYPWTLDPELLMSYDYVAVKRGMVTNSDLDEDRYKTRVTGDQDMPTFLSYWYYRLQYMSAINQYTKIMPASHMVARGYIEAQYETDTLKQAIVDEQAVRKQQEYAAMQSILVPGGIGGDEFTYDSGF